MSEKRGVLWGWINVIQTTRDSGLLCTLLLKAPHRACMQKRNIITATLHVNLLSRRIREINLPYELQDGIAIS